MFPLAVVSQGRHELYTIVPIDESRLTSLSLYDHFISKIKRQPKAGENIKFVVNTGVNLIGGGFESEIEYNKADKNSSVYIRRGEFLTNKLHLENNGSILGRGGRGRSNMTAVYSILGGRNYIVPKYNVATGGRAIVNESDQILHVTNRGVIAGGGGGGGGGGRGGYSTAISAAAHTDRDWYSNVTLTPGGGGVPYGDGGIESHRAEDFMEGNYDSVIEAQARTVKIIPTARAAPAALYRYLGSPAFDLYDSWDTINTKYYIPMTFDPSNYLPEGLILYWRVTSPIGSNHYNKYKAHINGSDKDRLFFNKTKRSIQYGGGRSDPILRALYALTPPRYVGGSAALAVPGKGGYEYAEMNRTDVQDIDPYVPARGGDGGTLGRRGQTATDHESIIMYKYNNPGNLTQGYVTKTIGEVKATGLKVNGIYIDALGMLPPGNPGYLIYGNVVVTNEGAGKTAGRIDVSKLAQALKQFGNVKALKHFRVIHDVLQPGVVAARLKRVDMFDTINGGAYVPITDFNLTPISIINDVLKSITIDIKTQLPADSHYLVINEYGIHSALTVTANKVTIDDIIFNLTFVTEHNPLQNLELVLVCADAATISKIRENIEAMKLHGLDWYGRTQ